MRRIDLVGKTFGHLTVVSCGELVGKHLRWNCICVCGKNHSVASQKLRTGEVSSCGCKKGEMLAAHKTTHGGSNTREFRIWSRMKTRCSNPKHNRYHRYGGRGIRVCDRWLESFENFLADMGPCPDGMSIERKNNDLDYCKDNCIWATPTEQALNRSTARLIEFAGRTMHISQWESEMGFTHGRITKRLALGWSIEKAIITPAK